VRTAKRLSVLVNQQSEFESQVLRYNGHLNIKRLARISGIETRSGDRSMVRTMHWLAASALAMMIIAERGIAQGVPTRPCASADLNGTYVLVDFREIPERILAQQASSFAYRFLAFSSLSAWGEVAYGRAPATLNEANGDLKGQMRDRTYALQADGKIILNRSKAVEFAGTCSVSLHSGDGFQENDLVLVGSYAREESVLHELFRRWTGEPLAKVTTTFDPAPEALTERPKSTAELPGVQPTMPDKPIPLRVNVVTGGGPGGPNTQVSVIVTNDSHAPLSAFMLVFRGAQTAQRWKDSDVDACLEHRPPWQPGEKWTKMIGMPIQVGNIQVGLGAAIFSDGSMWGTPERLAKLKANRGSCEWPQ
jgi:hypothetical protein